MAEIEDEDIAKRVEWLDDFHEAQWQMRAALRTMESICEGLYGLGLEGIAAKFDEPLTVARESLETMGSAVSRNIQEQAQESYDQIGKTFAAILEVATQGKEHDDAHTDS